MHDPNNIVPSEHVIQATRKWLEAVVIGLNLCPFAKPEFVTNKIHYCYTDVALDEALLELLASELFRLEENSDLSTTLIVHPQVLNDFNEYNQFLDLAEQLLTSLNFEGVYQVVGFHPQFQYADLDERDVSNYTNRSPYPMLHILREADVTLAVKQQPEIDAIPQKNTDTLQRYGKEKMQALLSASYVDNSS